MSKDCSSGTPDFIIVASWRVNRVMSFSVILPPPLKDCFLILSGRIPWRRSVVLTTVSVIARISPRTALPALSLPSQAKTDSLGPDFFLSALSAEAIRFP